MTKAEPLQVLEKSDLSDPALLLDKSINNIKACGSNGEKLKGLQDYVNALFNK